MKQVEDFIKYVIFTAAAVVVVLFLVRTYAPEGPNIPPFFPPPQPAPPEPDPEPEPRPWPWNFNEVIRADSGSFREIVLDAPHKVLVCFSAPG